MFDPWLEQLLTKHANAGALVDANLLFLYCVGLHSEALVSVEKGTREYTIEDFRLLQYVLRKFKVIVSTPSILTEVVNLSDRLRTDVRTLVRRLLRDKLLTVIDERFLPSVSVSNDAGFERLGLTDASIAMLADSGYLVLTNDLDLYLLLDKRKKDCIHYNSTLRPLVLDLI